MFSNVMQTYYFEGCKNNRNILDCLYNLENWHIDHIKPVSAFIAEGVTDPAIINALDNLQPLWAKDNQAKGSDYVAI